jgi:predicted phosphodiesterase
MQVAVLSDIHSNRHALEAVLDDIERTGARELWCLGDLVGYGADPNDCCALVRGSVSVCIAGNHDMAVTGELSLEDFSRGAALAADWTKDVIRSEHLDYLMKLRPELVDGEIALYHGSPRDPVWEYVVGALLAELCLDRLPGRIGLIGHSHVALSFNRLEGQAATGAARRDGETLDISEGSWLLNPGSVGQPRDGDPRAAWMLLDLGAGTASWRRVDYDVDGAAAAIRDARLPDSLAERLGYGQ